jgi:hypothetical protein
MSKFKLQRGTNELKIPGCVPLPRRFVTKEDRCPLNSTYWHPSCQVKTTSVKTKSVNTKSMTGSLHTTCLPISTGRPAYLILS